MDKKYKIYTMFVLFIVALTAPFSAANAAQCIWNKSGFVLKASWYNPNDIKAIEQAEVVDGVQKLKKVLAVKEGKKPVQVDKWPTAQGRCTRGTTAKKKHTVILSVVDGKVASDFVKIGGGIVLTTVSGISSTVVGAAVCAGTVGVGCAASAAGIVLATAGTAAGINQIPDAKDVFYIGTPSSSHYLDVWGTIWKPQIGKGGVSPGELVWAESRAHDKGCSSNQHIYHVRCEFRNNGQSNLNCPNMTTAGKFKGKKIKSVKRLNDRAWTEVKVNGC